MELSIGIGNNRNSWIQQIFRLAQQFMIKRGRELRERGEGRRGIIRRTNIPFSKYENALSAASNKILVSAKFFVNMKRRRVTSKQSFVWTVVGLAPQFEGKFWLFCRFFLVRLEEDRHHVDALVHLWPSVCQAGRQGSNFIRGTADAALPRAVRTG